MKQVVIIGGGIAGLATAYYLHERGRGDVEYKLVDSVPAFGGKIVSRRENGFVVEGGPDSFLTTKPAALDLCRELGLGDELIGTNDAARKVFVWSRGKLRKMPDGVMLIVPTRFMPFVTSSLISLPGKLRMGMDAIIPRRRGDEDESLAHFVRRRLGSEALDRIAEPMIAGIYVADAENLSLKSTFPRFLDMEKKYGSLIRGSLAARRSYNGKSNGNGKPAPPMFMTLRGGLQQMTDAIVERLDHEALIPNRCAVRVFREDGAFSVMLSDGSVHHADQVVFATPAYAAGHLLEKTSPELADSLLQLRYVSTATVSLGYKSSELNHSLDGFGFVVPRSEKRKIIACSWSSTKFNYRAKDGFALVRAFVGGVQAEHLAELDETTIARMVREEMRDMMGITATPVMTRVYRWHKANPQYEVGHQERVAHIEELAASFSGLHLVGAAYRGVGIPDCIEDGKRAAEQILKSVKR